MKRWLFLTAVGLSALSLHAQREDSTRPTTAEAPAPLDTLVTTTSVTHRPLSDRLADGLAAPYWERYDHGALHPGFNAQVSLSAAVAFGKHAPKGVGFGQTATFAYVVPLTKRLSLAAGLSAAHLNWGGYDATDVGLSAFLNYKVSERLDVFAYGTKSFLSSERRARLFPPYAYEGGDRIGAGAHYKFNDTFSMQIVVETVTNDGPNPYNFGLMHSGLRPMMPYGW